MDTSLLPILLGLATLLPLLSFFLLLATGRWWKPTWTGYVATSAIVGAGLLSLLCLGIWITHHYPSDTHQASHEADHGDDHSDPDVAPSAEPVDLMAQHHAPEDGSSTANAPDHRNDAADEQPPYGAANGFVKEVHETNHGGSSDESNRAAHHEKAAAGPYTGNYYELGNFGDLRLTISYYIDALTIVMFCVVTLIASCIHFYSMGYMHEEEQEVTDHEVTLANGKHLKRRGRYWVFFQYLSLFCFSMLGLVLAGNVAMVFIFWELVGICSYFLIGFYIERKSASNAANKAFIVNRIGDAGMIIGLMAFWAGLGTLAFGDIDANEDGRIAAHERGIFSLVRPADQNHQLITPDGMVEFSARHELAAWATEQSLTSADEIETLFAERKEELRAAGQGTRYGYGLMIVAGIGIFCGCVGKSAQFPLHVWLPDAMEGPTPVSALVHSATMVAAGVYLVGRFYPAFTPEVLLVIAVIGVITLFIAATIAITATDIKRVLAYSTVSQLGYMMLALGLGGWLAGMMHLVTHAFFKSLLFMCSGSVIHAVHTNELPEMGGLRHKMPYTAYTMLVGCLAISGISIPFLIGFSGYYSKDMILEQAFSFLRVNGSWSGSLFFVVATLGAAITAFYMFRLWFLTFAGEPRNQDRYDHAHESPKVMYVPLVILAVFATAVAWEIPFVSLNLKSLLEQARPTGTAATVSGALVNMTWPNEHLAHAWSIKIPVTLLATFTALVGIGVAVSLYLYGWVRPEEIRRRVEPVYQLLLNKWWFDELYDRLFVQPLLWFGRIVAAIDRLLIDRLIDGVARAVTVVARFWAWLGDSMVIDRAVDSFAHWTYVIGLSLRRVQTGRLRQYVLFLVMAAIVIYLTLTVLVDRQLIVLR
jgi:NADH:ubiquinone oxidoreductase subunit 5 (subunit L)/multisubunit Na+/H+ antiporter MnhA subunit